MNIYTYTHERIERSRNMIDSKEYEFYKMEVIADPDRPHTFSNEPLADAFYCEFVKEYPDTTLHKGDTSQYICMNEHARRALLKQIEQTKAKQVEELRKTEKLWEDIHKSIIIDTYV